MIYSSSMTFGREPNAAIPRGAAWAAEAALFVLKAGHRLVHWAFVPHRPLADIRPQPAGEPRTAEDVLAWAAQLEADEPAFANDLRAAVWRAQG